ncbi:MAG: DEAD/DEAH box helicase, partial [Flavobacteriales bacterium]|nr:DEAD/DEAH box helicase [Flavobacteriales bacterium]
MSFKDLGLSDSIIDAIQQIGYDTPTPIQAQAIPSVLEGRDLLGSAQTGTGKTAAFTLPIIHLLGERPSKSQGRSKPIRALIITPTRELASQIDDNVRNYCKNSNLRSTVVFGGIPQRRQVDAIRRGIDILIATPGRLLDLCNQGHIRLGDVEVLVLDEADTMLDMGFIHDIKKIIKQCPSDRQTLFFSATMPDNIRSLSSSILNDPLRIQIAAVSSAAETVEQKVYYVRQSDKKDLLVHLLENEDIANALVFTRTKYGADKVVRHLQNNNIPSEAIHGNKSQPAREKALNRFKKGRVRVLVATDIASRGIDVDDLSHVFNFELPNLSESYVHRIGRTGRAGREGTAISFCNEGDERNYLRGIQKLLDREIELITDQPYNMPMDPVGMVMPKGGGKKNSRKRGGGGGRGYGGGGGSRASGRSSYGSSDNRERSPRRFERDNRGRGDRKTSVSNNGSSSNGYGKPSDNDSRRDGRNEGYKGSSFGPPRNRDFGDRSDNRGSGGYSRDRSDNRGDRSDNREFNNVARHAVVALVGNIVPSHLWGA